MSVLIKGITLDDFIRYGGEYAAYLDGTGCTVELPDHILAEGEIDKWWERNETVNVERNEDERDNQ